MDAQSLKEMQKEELEAIEAIYMDDYINHTKGSGPPMITLKLNPLQSVVGKDVYARLDLRVQYTTRYPLDAPVLSLENEKGISKDQLAKLKKKLDRMASELCGEVMVLQLAQHVQSYLHQFNVPNLSFFEQMLVNQQKLEEIMIQEEVKKREAAVAEDRERDQDVIRQVKEELVKRGEVLKQEKRKRKESYSISSPPYGSPQNGTFEAPRTSSFSCPLSKERKLSVIIFRGKHEDRKLFCSSCIGHYFHGACCLSAIDETSGKPMTVVEWKRKVSTRKKKVHFSLNSEKLDTDAVLKQIQSIEQEFNYLKTKVHFNGLLNYHCLDIDHSANAVSAKILMDTIPGIPLSSCLHDGGLSISHIQSLCREIVDILAFIHSKSVVHRDLGLCNTFLISNNHVVLSGYSIIARISDLCKLVNVCEEDTPVSLNSFNEFKEIVKPGKKGDIFYLGLMLLSLYAGHTKFAVPVKIPENAPEKFKSFLKSCLEGEESKRSTVQQLSKHPFLHEKISPALSLKHDDGEKNESIGSDGSVNVSSTERDVYLPIYPDHLILGKSRLMNEFEIIEWIGKGGFGSVIKVRNKLDGNYYAIKRIQLMPKSLYLKRITREVKLLSRLNHENVVRYFNSWIEAEDITFQEESVSELDTETFARNQQKVKKSEKSNPIRRQRRDLEESLLGMNDIDFNDCPGANENNDTSWCDNESHREASSSSDSESDEVYASKVRSVTSSMRSRSSMAESSEGIVFEIEDSIMQFGDRLDSDSEEEQPTNQTESTEDSSETPSIQYLYIQMEFCERSTLRTAIDNGLYKEPERVWRYFREIVEGIAHVHGQGIIHRDLKPINIFMDSCNRIKIGDFGLATSHGTSKPGTASDSQASTDGASGKVGTLLYVAPEVCESSTRIKISPKVDIYSLGIILFEMLHQPLDTKMERVKVISMLRREMVVFPEDFPLKKYAKEHNLLTWVLNHDPDLRPTAQELLESGYIPPKMEDSQLDELLKHTLSQSSSARYKRLMSALFNQSVSPVADQLYDSLNQGRTEGIIKLGARILQHVHGIVTRVFTRHCAVFLEVPLFMPKTKLFDQFSDAARFIDQSGLQLCLPYDSRISFARYISKNNICNMKRYYFGKLYREQKIMGAHPAGSWECSYDIVTDCSSSCVPESEILHTVYEIIREFPRLHSRHFFVRLNHTSLMKAIFDQTNLKEETQSEIFQIIEKTENLKVLEAALRDYFIRSNFSEHVINKLLLLLTFEGTLSKAKETFQMLRKSREGISSLTKKAFSDIETLLKHLDNLKFDMPVHVCTYMLPTRTRYSELFFQIVAVNKHKHKRGGVDILAAGGCYNNLVVSMSKYAETAILPHAVGVSINVEKLLHSVLDAHKDENMSQCLSECDVIVCGVSKMLLQILQDLWCVGINADLFSYELKHDYNLEDIQDYCKNNGVSHIVILRETDLEYVRLRSLEKDAKKEEKFTDYGMRIHVKDLCNILTQKLSSRVERTEKELDVVPKVGGPHSSNIVFHYLEKLESKERRKYESIFLTKFLSELQCSYGSNQLLVVVAKLENHEVKTVAAFLEMNGTKDEYEASMQEIMQMYNGQGRFMKICNAIYYHEQNGKSIVILSSYTADLYRIIGIVKSS